MTFWRIQRVFGERRLYRTSIDWLRSLHCRFVTRMGIRRNRASGNCIRIHLRDIDQPLYIRPGTTDCWVLKQIFVEGEYSGLVHAQHVKTVVDLGANIGLFTRFVGMHWPNVHVVCVEPDPGNAEVLRKNVDVDGVFASVEIMQTFIAATQRTVAFDRSRGEWAIRMADATGGYGATDVAETMTMRQVVAALGEAELDIVKCDIEGAEKELFADCRDWINRVRTLIVETHGDYRPDDLFSDLARNGSLLQQCQTVKESEDQFVVRLERPLGIGGAE